MLLLSVFISSISISALQSFYFSFSLNVSSDESSLIFFGWFLVNSCWYFLHGLVGDYVPFLLLFLLYIYICLFLPWLLWCFCAPFCLRAAFQHGKLSTTSRTTVFISCSTRPSFLPPTVILASGVNCTVKTLQTAYVKGNQCVRNDYSAGKFGKIEQFLSAF